MLVSRLTGTAQAGLTCRWAHSSSSVRQQFFDFFKERNHVLVRSSPVVPYNDPTLMFVNAGMNQFKSVLQNRSEAPARRVFNTQKCIRVGGKHNDLAEVGSDGSHLTMFEMLGSWSFGDYFKPEACALAWALLTQQYRLDPRRLYVTYFGGCEPLGLPPDYEVREIWLQLGVPESHILPFGMKDNFWEMGASGPCGPCTEIHYDQGGKGAQWVNKGTPDNMEIWNIVFIQYDRSLDGVLSPLEPRHVDTGMGMERLLAVLNNSTSAFNTDLFTPILAAIHRISKVEEYSGRFGEGSDLDTAYRILADHARMITVCLSDNVFPDQNHKLKYVIRRAFTISQKTFGVRQGMLQELRKYVTESLGETFPELQKSEKRVELILDFEEENFKNHLDKSKKSYAKLLKEYPEEAQHLDPSDASMGFLHSLRLVDAEGAGQELSPALAFKLYESHGMQVADLVKLASIRKLDFSREEFDRLFSGKKEVSKVNSSQAEDMKTVLRFRPEISATDDSGKYLYSRSVDGRYSFSSCKGEILQMVSQSNRVETLRKDEEGIIFLDKTCFYSEAGGQVGDTGSLRTRLGEFLVLNTQLVHGNLVAHLGRVHSGTICAWDTVTATVKPDTRFRCMQNHTATHVLNYVLHSLLPVTCQKSSLVTPEYLRYEFSVYKTEIDLQFLKEVERLVLDLIKQDAQVGRRTLASEQLLQEPNLVTLPGEVYPSVVSVIEVGGQTEPCCGTHLLHTGDIHNFVIVSCKTSSTGVKSLRCLTGDAAKRVREQGVAVCEEIIAFQDTMENMGDEINESNLEEIRSKISRWKSAISGPEFPVLLSLELSDILDEHQKKIKLLERHLQKATVGEQMIEAIMRQNAEPFLVHTLQFQAQTKVNFSQAAKMVGGKPCLLFSLFNGKLTGKAVVPANIANEHFNAKLWMDVVAERLGGEGKEPRGQDPRLVVNFRPQGLTLWDPEAFHSALKSAKSLAKKHFKNQKKPMS